MSEETNEVQAVEEELAIEFMPPVPEEVQASDEYAQALKERKITVREGMPDEATFELRVPTGFRGLAMLPKVLKHLGDMTNISVLEDTVQGQLAEMSAMVEAVAKVEEEVLFYVFNIEKDKNLQKFVREEMLPGEIVKVFNAAATYMSMNSFNNPAMKEALKN